MDILNKAGSTKMPHRRRRKEARPAELIEAASSVFGEKGYAATRLEDVAKRAGVSKATVYVYFENKESLFRAVARSAMTMRLADSQLVDESKDDSLAAALEKFITRFLDIDGKKNTFSLVRMVISEAHNFPDVACIWHDEVVIPIINNVANLISEAQSSGKVVRGNPRLIAFSVIGPLQMALLHQATFPAAGAFEVNLPDLVRQHLKILLHGLLPQMQKAT